MKLLTGWVVSAGLMFAATAANAEVLARYELVDSPYRAVSDFGGPYAAMPPDAPPPRYHPGYGYGPSLLPATEVYTVVREAGFSPLGIPRQRGFIYTISVIDRGGDDGRLVIDARTGRIIRFIRASRIGETFDDDLTATYGPAGPPPPVGTMRAPRTSLPAPRVASRPPSVPIPRASPQAAAPKPQATRVIPAPAQQSAVVQAKPADTPAVPQTAAPAAAPPPAAAPQVQPTGEMPKVQGLE